MPIDLYTGSLSFMQPSLRKIASQQPSWYSGFYNRSAPSFVMFPDLYRCRTCVVEMSMYLLGQASLHWVQLWFSVVVSICCEGSFFGDGWQLYLSGKAGLHIKGILPELELRFADGR